MSTSFCARSVSVLRACFLSAKKCFLRQFGAYLFLRSASICAHVSYLRRSVFYAKHKKTPEVNKFAMV